MAETTEPAKRTTRTDTAAGAFTDEERAAMKERAQELKTARRRGPAGKAAEDEKDVLARIAEMSAPDRAVAERLHALIRDRAPHLAPRLWYGMPAYAKDGKVLCFFQSAEKFKSRYSTLGFNDVAALDDGAMWPTAFALTELTEGVEARIADIITRAAA